jgi:1,2-phenylacetyl-CoA epoxidase PaaB subunit
MHEYRRVHEHVRVYEVFARKTRGDSLRLVGSVVAPDDDLAAAYARATYDEERWIEMSIVPRESITTLWAPGSDQAD